MIYKLRYLAYFYISFTKFSFCLFINLQKTFKTKFGGEIKGKNGKRNEREKNRKVD